MQKMLRIPILLLLLMAVISSCKKDQLLENEPSFSTSSNYTNPNVFYSGGANYRSGEEGQTLTILGQPRSNPYDVNIMTQAWNNLFTTPISEIETTNRYIKFCPADYEELAALADLDLSLYDYPLEYEVIELGDYWIDPALGEDAIPCFYAVVKPDFTSPSLSFEIISNLHIEPVETELTEEAFRITGNTFAGLISRECEIDDPRWPECQCDNLPPAEKEACLADLENGGGDPPGGSTSCVFNNHPRNPSGHIRVVDTQLGLQPVKKVKVTLKNNWFTEDVTYTDDNGCFFINSRYRGNAKMKVSFKNSHAKIHSLRQYKVWEYFYAVTDNIGLIKRGPVYTNISVTYNNSTSATSRAKRYWMAATVHNAIQEYRDYAANDNILLPGEDLRVVISTWGDEGTGGAPMIKQGLDQSLLYNLSEYVLFPFFPKLSLLMELVQQNAPDIVYSYGATAPSDQIKATMYHEMAHASHFALVGNSYWNKIRYHEVVNSIANGDPYGFPGNFAAGSAPGRVSITESWGEHIGLSYAHRQYGGSNSLSSLLFSTWEERIESRIFTNGFIPDGLHFDLIDNQTDINGVVDNVSGFNNSQIFSSITSDVHTIPEYQAKLIQNHLGSTSNTESQVNNLFNSY